MSKSTPSHVKEYYNKMTSSYLDIYGDVIQAYRPSDTTKLLDYIGRSAGINWNLNVLDLGCGVAGPAIYFANRWNVNIEGVTISDIQLKEGNIKIEQSQFQHKIKLHLGDYHHLNVLPLQDNYYDVVLFLESLGHSNDIATAIQQATAKLKNGGSLYIKDFYKKQVNDINEQKKIDKVIANIDKYYFYNTLHLDEVLMAIENAGLKIVLNQHFDFVDDVKVRFEFENENKIDIFEGLPEFHPADWLEIKCVK